MDPNKLLKGKKILVVDDDPIVQTLVRNILERAGYDVFTAASGEDAR